MQRHRAERERTEGLLYEVVARIPRDAVAGEKGHRLRVLAAPSRSRRMSAEPDCRSSGFRHRSPSQRASAEGRQCEYTVFGCTRSPRIFFRSMLTTFRTRGQLAKNWLSYSHPSGTRSPKRIMRNHQPASGSESRTFSRGGSPVTHSLLRLGRAEFSLGRHESAQLAFERAHERAAELGDPYRFDVAPGLAQVALARGDFASAGEPLLNLDEVAIELEGTDSPRLIELICHRVLTQRRDPRAIKWLKRSSEALHMQASTIPDAAMRR